jgi:cold shock CspA family protein
LPAPSDVRSWQRGSRHVYKVADLEHPETRARVDADLKDKRWKVTVKSVSPEKGFGFAVHGDFNTNLFFPFSAISDPNSYGISARQTLDVVVASRFDRKKEMWGFSVVSGRVDA